MRPTFVPVALLLLLVPAHSLGQAEGSRPFSEVGIGVKASLLGAGIEAATPLAPGFNLRAGFNAFSYNRTFAKDGVSYGGQLRFRSAEAHLDWFPFANGFHVSPGVLVYNGNQITANAAVPGGQTFTLNSTTYTSDPANPITGSGKIDFYKAGPMLSVGWGNLLPRGRHRFSIPFEIGAIYTGSPKVTLNLPGGACDSSGLNCQPINSDPSFQSNVTAEKGKLNKDMSPFKFYPVISVGFGVKF